MMKYSQELYAHAPLEKAIFSPLEISEDGHGSARGVHSAVRDIKAPRAKQTYKTYRRVDQTDTFAAADGTTIPDVGRESAFGPAEKKREEMRLRRQAMESKAQDKAARRVAEGVV